MTDLEFGVLLAILLPIAVFAGWHAIKAFGVLRDAARRRSNDESR